MRTGLYYPTIDRMLCEMNSRFSPQNNDVMLGVCACSPSSDTFLDIPPLTKLAAHYDLEFSEPEVLVARNYIKSLQSKEEKTFTMEQVHRLLDEAFPRLKTLFQVALTIPVTSCSCEWSFSHFRRMKTWLGTRMMQERLDDLAVLAIVRGTYTTCTDEWWQAGDCLQLYEEKKNISVMYVSGP